MIATTTDRMAELLDTLLAQAAPWRRCCERPLLEVGASAAVLERIMASGLGNAVRYAVRRITVTAARRTPGVVISVVDDGPGVAEEFRDQVFEPGQEMVREATRTRIPSGRSRSWSSCRGRSTVLPGLRHQVTNGRAQRAGQDLRGPEGPARRSS